MTYTYEVEPLSDAEHPRSPAAIRPYYDELVKRTDAVCRDHLNDEYLQLCRKLAAALCRKRPSPVTRGRIDSWACGIAYTIGYVNFLSDRSKEPNMKMADLCKLFDVGSSTGMAKSAEIRRMLKIRQMDPTWSLKSMIDRNPMAWLISVNGIIVDARDMIPEIQEEAFRRGMIPYIPGAEDDD